MASKENRPPRQRVTSRRAGLMMRARGALAERGIDGAVRIEDGGAAMRFRVILPAAAAGHLESITRDLELNSRRTAPDLIVVAGEGEPNGG